VLAIELDGVRAGYSAREGGTRDVLHDVGLTVRRGQLWALLGPNGAGKSTLLRVVAGLLPASQGRVRLLGDDPGTLGRREVARRVALVPQQAAVALGFTVREVVAMGRAPHQGALMRPSAADRDAVAKAIAACQLDEVAARAVASLSGGERQRVHIARALAQEAPVLLLDEAGAHLDIRHKLGLFRLIRDEVASRALACMATMHDLTDAVGLASHAVLLREGRVLAQGPVEEVMTAPLLAQAFDTPIQVGAALDGRRYVLPG
jgi:iron complex transport system ATP-binding protein